MVRKGRIISATRRYDFCDGPASAALNLPAGFEIQYRPNDACWHTKGDGNPVAVKLQVFKFVSGRFNKPQLPVLSDRRAPHQHLSAIAGALQRGALRVHIHDGK